MHKQTLIFIIGILLIVGWFYPGKPKTNVTEPIQTEKMEYLIISKLDINVPIVYIDSKSEDEIQKGLLSGVVHVAGTALPGEVGDSYIVGHSSDYPQSPGQFKQIFARLPELKVGDEIIIKRNDQELNFKVIESKIVEPNDLSVLDQETFGKKLLTLQTSYPVGTAKQRFILVAKLSEK